MAATKDKAQDAPNSSNSTTIAIPELPDPATLLDSQIEAAQANLDALKPAVDAFRAWEQFINSLMDVKEGRSGRTPRRSTTATTHRAPRGDRPQEFLNVLKDAGDDGLSVTDAAKAMGMPGPNYLYRLAPTMVDAGQIKKEGRKYVYVKDEPDGNDGE